MASKMPLLGTKLRLARALYWELVTETGVFKERELKFEIEVEAVVI